MLYIDHRSFNELHQTAKAYDCYGNEYKVHGTWAWAPAFTWYCDTTREWLTPDDFVIVNL